MHWQFPWLSSINPRSSKSNLINDHQFSIRQSPDTSLINEFIVGKAVGSGVLLDQLRRTVMIKNPDSKFIFINSGCATGETLFQHYPALTPPSKKTWCLTPCNVKDTTTVVYPLQIHGDWPDRLCFLCR